MPIKVLIVEDDPDVMMAMTEAMEEEGHTVLAATGISAADEMIKTGLPDVAIIDHGLPDGTGDQFAARLQAEGNTKIIMHSGEARRSKVVSSLDRPVKYVLKGSGIGELIDTVNGWADAA